MKKKFLILGFLSFFTLHFSHILSQVQQEWIHFYPDSTNSFNTVSEAMILDDSGNVYVTGILNANTNATFCTIKFSPNGTRLWVSNYIDNAVTVNIPYNIAIDSYSNIYVTGFCHRNAPYPDFCTIKYNSNGVQQWVRFYDGPIHGEDEAKVIAVDNANNIYVSGFSEIAGNHFVFTTLKYSADGRLIWEHNKVSGSVSDYVNSITVDDSCNVYICGDSFDSLIIKYDSAGNIKWAQTYDSVNASFGANSIAVDNFHNVYVTGFVLGTNTFSDFLTLKYSVGGEKLWERRYNADSTISGSSNGARLIILDSTDNVLISGYAGNVYSGIINFCTLKYSNSGNLIWVRRDTTHSSGTVSMDIDQSNNLYLTGNYFKNNTFNSIITSKINSLGEILWINNYIDSNAQSKSLKTDRNNNIYITGWKGGNATNNKIFIIKYSQPIGIRIISNDVPVRFKLFQNYPNPFNPLTTIEFSIPNTSYAKLIVYDLLGREVKKLVNEELKAGIYKISFDGDKLSSGVYYYKLLSGNYMEAKKMVLVK